MVAICANLMRKGYRGCIRCAALGSISFLETVALTCFLATYRFCQQDEEHDPSEEYESPTECAVCGKNGKLHHRLKRLYFALLLRRCIRPGFMNRCCSMARAKY